MSGKNWLYLTPFFLVLLLIVLEAFAGGTTTITEYKQGNVQRIVCNWASDATGDVNAALTSSPFSGRITCAIFEPGIGSASPDPNYDVSLKNPFGMDVLRGIGDNQSQTATSILQITTAVPLASDRLIFWVTNAGAVASGTAYFFVEP